MSPGKLRDFVLGNRTCQSGNGNMQVENNFRKEVLA